MTVLPASDTVSAPAGGFTRDDGPTSTMRPFWTRMVALGTTSAVVPSMSRAPVKARIAPAGAAWPGAGPRAWMVARTAADAARAIARDASFMASHYIAPLRRRAA